jgi:hypothetical protein
VVLTTSAHYADIAVTYRTCTPNAELLDVGEDGVPLPYATIAAAVRGQGNGAAGV